MIDEQKIIGMIPAKALGCLDLEDNLILQSYIDEGNPFSWDELGKYQNIAAMLPLALQLEIPEPRLKDNVALKLIELSEKLRSKKILEEGASNIPNSVEEVMDDKLDTTKENVDVNENDILFKDNALVEEFNLDDIKLSIDDVTAYPKEEQFGSQENNIEEAAFNNPIEPLTDEFVGVDFGETIIQEAETQQEADQYKGIDSSLNPQAQDGDFVQDNSTEAQVYLTDENNESVVENIDANESLVEESIKQDIPKVNEEEITSKPDTDDIKSFEDNSGVIKPIDISKKTLNEKIYKALEQDFDSLKSSVDEIERKNFKNLMWAYIAIAALLALLIFAFFKFTSDIKSLENEVKDMKKKVTSDLIYDNKFNSDSFSHS